MNRSAWRLPTLVVLAALLVGAVAVGSADDDQSEPRLDQLMPVVSDPDAVGSTWYCAAGSATGVAEGEGAGVAEHTVVLTSVADRPVGGQLTAYPDDGPPATVPVEVPAGGRSEVVVSDVLTANWAAAVVELDGGGVAVDHRLAGPSGSSISPCASRPSSQWYFPAGTTRPGASTYVALFNPFPGEASVDLTFETEQGARETDQFQGIAVPAGQVTVVDVTPVVTDRAELATTATARSGRIVAEQLLVDSGREGVAEGLTSVLGAPAPAVTWVFPDGSTPRPGATSSYAVFNPTEDDAEVEVQVFLDDPEVNGSVEPFSLTLPGGRHDVVDVFEDGRIPEGVGNWVMVRSVNDVVIVAERLDGGAGEATSTGFAAAMGAPTEATDWVLPVSAVAGAESVEVAVANPAAVGEVTVTLEAFAAGAPVDLGEAATLVLAAGTRGVVVLSDDLLGLDELSLVARADGPVVAAAAAVLDGDLAAAAGMPVEGSETTVASLARPEAFQGDLGTDGSAEDPGAGSGGEGGGSDTTVATTAADGASDDGSTTTTTGGG